jgi:hypothetical protein
MRRTTCIIAIALLAFSQNHAQTRKDPLKATPAEQKEIKAAQHLEKEMQRKQLFAKPGQLADPAAASQTKKKAIQSKKKHKSPPTE